MPVPVMARAFVGAHVAILEAWLAGELDGDVEELAHMTLDLLIYGTAWVTDSASTSSDTQPDSRPIPANRRQQPQSRNRAVLSLPVPPYPRTRIPDAIHA